MNQLAKSPFLDQVDLHIGTEGEFAGWRSFRGDAFETSNGPFWHRMEDDGRIRCAFRVKKKHLNGAKNVYGGCFMSFADYCLFATASPILKGPGVTLSFACEFLDAAREGERIEGLAEITRAGNSIIFLRGMLTSAERPVFSFSGSIKRVARKVPPPASAGG